jgi:acetyl esterase/lipase
MSEQTVIELWPGTPPGGKGVVLEYRSLDMSHLSMHTPEHASDRIGRPFFTVFPSPRPNGSAVLIMPGGGYGQLWYEKEGDEIAQRLGEGGMTGFVLQYRLPCEGWAGRADVPLQDAQRAMRLIRNNAAQYGVDPLRLGVMGFSAGGHLAASLATRFAAKVYAPVDDADAADARPAFAALMYPVITMGEGTHEGSRDNLLGPGAPPEAIAAYSCEQLVTGKTPPAFLAHAMDDGTVPFAANSLAMTRALMKAKVPCQLHAFEAGGHGFALRDMEGKPYAAWPDLFLAWAKSRGVMGTT